VRIYTRGSAAYIEYTYVYVNVSVYICIHVYTASKEVGCEDIRERSCCIPSERMSRV